MLIYLRQYCPKVVRPFHSISPLGFPTWENCNFPTVLHAEVGRVAKILTQVRVALLQNNMVDS